jgi:hypothetical protein
MVAARYSAARVGEHSAVVWNRLYLNPPVAAPNPASSIKTTSTFGAPAGGRSGVIGGKLVAGSLAS